MKPLEIIYRRWTTDACPAAELDTEATLQAIIDRVNEHTLLVQNKIFQEPTKRFKAEDIQTFTNIEVVYLSKEDGVLVFKSQAEAQAALELLLNL